MQQMNFSNISMETNGTIDTFSKASSIWINRPNVCNKIVSCCTITEISLHPDASDNGDANLISRGTINNVKENILEKLSLTTFPCGKLLTKGRDFSDSTLLIRKLVPRRPDFYKNSYELVIRFSDLMIFVPISDTYLMAPNSRPYALYFHTCELCVATISACSFESESMIHSKEMPKKECWPSKEWIKTKLLPTIVKWSNEEMSKQTEISQKNSTSFPPSLSLINAEVYTKTYNHLKKKYGLELTKVWPEVTDPQKYVYEDVAIASYLLTLWKQERKDSEHIMKQSFIDLGCGNGLLVYILNCEGHPGIGLDIRKRKVWDLFGDKANLKEAVVTPDDLSNIQGYDWLLGNHSDELTPWIPVMASRLGFCTKFWVLPCCFFDFYGKYGRKQSLHGQYKDYLDFVGTVSEMCGFNVQQDVMRIPSTKRVCFVGDSRSYEESQHAEKLQTIENFINSRKCSDCVFTIRPKEEKIKNCTKISREIQTKIVETIVQKLLETSNIEICSSDIKSWNKGGKLPISEAASLFTPEQRSKLKSECGGLQTLLRNYHQVFKVKSGCVEIRNWCDLNEPVKKRKTTKDFIKTKPCWFYFNHPDGCPRTSSDCTFVHDVDLRS